MKQGGLGAKFQQILRMLGSFGAPTSSDYCDIESKERAGVHAVGKQLDYEVYPWWVGGGLIC